MDDLYNRTEATLNWLQLNNNPPEMVKKKKKKRESVLQADITATAACITATDMAHRKWEAACVSL